MQSTVIACLTPAGAGAIATLAVRGPQAWAVTRSLFHGRLPEHAHGGKLYLGRLGESAGACDEVVLAVKPDWLELHCHGGALVVRFLQELFAARGVRAGSWEDITGADEPPLRRSARDQLVQAPTVATAAVLLDQAQGAFEKTLAAILACLQSHDHAGAGRLLSRLAQTEYLGRHLVQPFRVVLAGAPNVGKSSLVNAVAGHTRSVVSPIPGTTRDVVTTRIALACWPVELSDTAGLHASADRLENEGMARARLALGQADLRLWVLDASAPAVVPPSDVSWNGLIVNKIDLPCVWPGGLARPVAIPPDVDAGPAGPVSTLSSMSSTPSAYVSCQSGQGLTELCQWIGSLLRLEQGLTPGEGVAFTPQLADKMLEANEAARAGNWQSVKDILEQL